MYEHAARCDGCGRRSEVWTDDSKKAYRVPENYATITIYGGQRTKNREYKRGFLLCPPCQVRLGMETGKPGKAYSDQGIESRLLAIVMELINQAAGSEEEIDDRI